MCPFSKYYFKHNRIEFELDTLRAPEYFLPHLPQTSKMARWPFQEIDANALLYESDEESVCHLVHIIILLSLNVRAVL